MSRTENNYKDDLDGMFIGKLLDSYFQFRASLPEAGYIQENKTTQQIQDELNSMYPLTAGDIVRYMTAHGFSTLTEPDGTVSWAIWRQV